MYAIETFNLTKKYVPPHGVLALLSKSPIKKEVLAVNKVNFKVGQGELFGLIGPNGAGKTTLIKMLCTLLWPTSGKALVNGYDLTKEEEKAKASIGFVSGEERSFYWRLTGRQNLQFFAALHNLSPQVGEKRIDEILRQLGLKEAADNMFYSYSSGMKQKLSLARGLLTDPAILFLDEPTKSVDAITAQKLKGFIRENLVDNQKRTVFLTTHRLEEAEQLCDRLAIMKKGEIIFCGTIEELKRTLRSSADYILRVKGLASNALIQMGKTQNLAHLSVGQDDGEEGLTLKFSCTNGKNPLSGLISDIFAAGGNLLSCYRQERSLEEIFVELLKESSQEN